jgi:hypothetical protein
LSWSEIGQKCSKPCEFVKGKEGKTRPFKDWGQCVGDPEPRRVQGKPCITLGSGRGAWWIAPAYAKRLRRGRESKNLIRESTYER